MSDGNRESLDESPLTIRLREVSRRRHALSVVVFGYAGMSCRSKSAGRVFDFQFEENRLNREMPWKRRFRRMAEVAGSREAAAAASVILPGTAISLSVQWARSFSGAFG